MDFKDFETGINDISRRLDKVIRLFASSLSLPEIYKGIRKGLIKVNNKKTKSEYRIQENDVINIASFLLENNEKRENETSKNKEKENKNLIKPDIVFENDDLLIINKPYNINVHGDETSLDKVIEHYYKETCTSSSISFTPGPLHRLDRNTTGLIAFSKSLKGAHWFSENIKKHVIQKKYYGLSTNILKKEQNWVDVITKDDENGKAFHTVKARKLKKDEDISSLSEKIADTTARPLAYGNYLGKDVTLIEYSIKTGRKHQIRSQSSLHGYPLLGDTAYGEEKLSKKWGEFFLTAKSLSFPLDNPLSLPEKIEIPLPKRFIDILKDCGINKVGVQ